MSHYFIVCGNTVIVDGEWYCDSYVRYDNLDAVLRSITGCEYLEFGDDREMAYKWMDGINHYG